LTLRNGVAHLKSRRKLKVAIRQSVFIEVMLVVIFGAPEIGGGHDLGDNRTDEVVRGFEARLGGFGGGFLAGRVVEDDGAVLGADVGALAVGCGGVVIVPEDVEKLVVGDFGRS
jgi:hypothetical protein